MTLLYNASLFNLVSRMVKVGRPSKKNRHIHNFKPRSHCFTNRRSTRKETHQSSRYLIVTARDNEYADNNVSN